MVVFVRIDAAVFPFLWEGRQLHCAFRGYTWVRYSLRPAGLLNSLSEPLSGNSVLQVTPHTSLKLYGWATKFPQSDLNRPVIRVTRHTIGLRNLKDYWQWVFPHQIDILKILVLADQVTVWCSANSVQFSLTFLNKLCIIYLIFIGMHLDISKFSWIIYRHGKHRYRCTLL